MCKQICQVKPYLFEDFLIISLDRQWIDVHGGEIPTFTAVIDEEGRLNLVGPKIHKFNSEKKEESK